jgi:hypothetical protein
VKNILEQAGFSKIAIAPSAIPIIGESLAEEAKIACFLGPAGALLDEKKADPKTRAEILEEITGAMAKFQTQAGMSSPATVFVVTAEN